MQSTVTAEGAANTIPMDGWPEGIPLTGVFLFNGDLMAVLTTEGEPDQLFVHRERTGWRPMYLKPAFHGNGQVKVVDVGNYSFEVAEDGEVRVFDTRINDWRDVMPEAPSEDPAYTPSHSIGEDEYAAGPWHALPSPEAAIRASWILESRGHARPPVRGNTIMLTEAQKELLAEWLTDNGFELKEPVTA